MHSTSISQPHPFHTPQRFASFRIVLLKIYQGEEHLTLNLEANAISSCLLYATEHSQRSAISIKGCWCDYSNIEANQSLTETQCM